MKLSKQRVSNRRAILQGFVLLYQPSKIGYTTYTILLTSLMLFSASEAYTKLTDNTEHKNKSTSRQIIEVVEPIIQCVSTLSLLKFHLNKLDHSQLTPEQTNSFHSVTMAFDFAIFLQSVLNFKKGSLYRLSSVISLGSMVIFGESAKVIQSTCRGVLGIISVCRFFCAKPEKKVTANTKKFQPHL